MDPEAHITRFRGLKAGPGLRTGPAFSKDGLGRAVDHAEVAQDAEDAANVQAHGFLVGAPEEAGLGRDGRLAPENGRVTEVF